MTATLAEPEIVVRCQTSKSLAFLTAIPQTVHGGSGCYVGIGTLAAGLTALGHNVETCRPKIHCGSFLADRYFFNQSLRFRRDWNCDTLVGFDLDGFALPRRGGMPHVANIKGVLADAVRFEQGISRAKLALQARWEAQHARRADLIVTISNYCKARLHEFYGVREAIAVVPELIDLETWRQLFRANPARKREDEFTVLCVCRFYPRKRVACLLQAAHVLESEIPGLRVRIVGGGPDRESLHQLARELKLEPVVTWVGEATRDELAREYNGADIFCLPSVQEGFGIVFLEAMAAGLPIVAARAAAVPEVVRHGLLAEPESGDDLAHSIWRLWQDRELRETIRAAQLRDVENYEMKRVAGQFLAAIG